MIPMRNNQIREPREFPPRFLLFQAVFSTLLLRSQAGTQMDKLFINCGSADNVTIGRRVFVGDEASGSLVSLKGRGNSETALNNLNPETSLYSTARVFRRESSYTLRVPENDSYMVRLHFASHAKLLKARFNVSTTDSDQKQNTPTSGFTLLSSFSPPSVDNPPTIYEFILSLSSGDSQITFNPEPSFIAFVNAIEVFPARDFFPSDKRTGWEDFLSKALHTFYRLNVGGLRITQGDDLLWREWSPDVDHLINPVTVAVARKSPKPPVFTDSLTNYTAPGSVYETARVMNFDASKSHNSNMTWRFNVSKNSEYFVRLHFFDFFSDVSTNTLYFNVSINKYYVAPIYPANETGDQPDSALFVKSCRIHSDESGMLNISLAPNPGHYNKTTFLNGLEVMEIKDPGTVRIHGKPGKIQDNMVIMGSAIGGLILVAVVILFVFLRHKQKSSKSIETSDWRPLAQLGSSHSATNHNTPLRNMNLGLRMPFAEIEIATNNFDPKLFIARGGFGNVYRGVLPDGVKVAVKRGGSRRSGQGFLEFQTEIQILYQIRHRHLVSLIGYCDENSEMILVYEFMENGTLRDHLYGSNLPPLTWKQRLEICIGAAKGLHYLHKDSGRGIIHRDVKSTNILLHEHLVAKVADFGLSKSGPTCLDDQTHVSTGIKGTLGYIDPEYFQTQMLTEKSDVYSFGVVLLEVLCARPALDALLPHDQVNLAEWAIACKNRGKIRDIVDPLLEQDDVDPNSLKKFVGIAEKCLREEGASRPAMEDVLWDLEYALKLHMTAVRRKPHEDSMPEDYSFAGPRLPDTTQSTSWKTEADSSRVDAAAVSTESSASEVFSLLKSGDAR